MAQSTLSVPAPLLGRKPFLGAAVVVLALLILIFHKSFLPDQTLFSNDGPLGAISSEAGRLPGGFFGVWLDLNWVGLRGIGASPNLSSLLATLTGPVLFSKIYAPFALFVLGACTWLFFRQLGFNPAVCLLGTVASVLNMNVFSTATWGLPNWSLARAMIFLALAALVTRATTRVWLKAALAGFAVGMAVMEGFDMGAIYSLFIAAFVLFQAWNEDRSVPAKAAGRGVLRLALVAGCAAFIATQSLSALIGTQVKGIVGTEQDERTKEEQWDWATQWSMPKMEMLRVLIPGLYGYRLDTPDGGAYWGSVGRTPGWEEHHQGLVRHSGSGEYSGVLVVLVAVWALLQSFLGPRSIFDLNQRRFIWFWAAAGFIAMLLAFGRHAPFYQVIYALPYFSTIRNPVKFLHPFQVSMLILFGFGLQGLYKRYVESGTLKAASSGLGEHLSRWWSTSKGFDRKWVLGCLAFFGISFLGWLIYLSSSRELERYLGTVAFQPTDAAEIASFSTREVGIYLVFLALSIGAVVLVMSGWLSGARAKWAVVVLGLVLAADLVRASLPWVIYYDYKEKYASNPVIDILRREPHLQRVSGPMFLGSPQAPYWPLIYNEWLQHHFQFYNVQSLDIIQMPRRPVEYEKFQGLSGAFSPTNAFLQPRFWQLTNTRFLLGMSGYLDPLNTQLDPGKNRFRIHTLFAFSQESDGRILVATNAVGPFALFEFTGALPRARLYSHWIIETNADVTLRQLADPNFDPEKTVIVAGDLPLPPAADGALTNADPGTVEIVDYEPKRIRLKAAAKAPAVLLYNDKYDSDWRVWVDGKESPLLQANYLMRGVYLTPGEHTVELRFQPPITGLYISLLAIAVGFGLLTLLFVSPGAGPPPGRAEEPSVSPADRSEPSKSSKTSKTAVPSSGR